MTRPTVRRKIAVASWRAPTEGRIHARAEVDVSEVRPGRKQGTLVATVRDPDLRVPTLIVGPA